MKVYVQTGAGGRFVWPSGVSSTLYEGLQSCAETETDLSLEMVRSPEAQQWLQLYLEGAEVRPDISGEILDEIEQAADYMGSIDLLRTVWRARGFTYITTEPCTLSREEIDGRSGYDSAESSFQSSERPPIQNSFLDPHEEWNLMYFIARSPPSDLHGLPGTDGLGGGRVLAHGALAGDFTITPFREHLCLAIQQHAAVLLDPALAPFWYDPAYPDRPGFVVAGGCALFMLQPDAVSLRENVAPYHDIDIFFVGDPEACRELLRRWVSILSAHIPDVLFRTPNTITLGSYQLITRTYERLEDVFAAFDFNVAKIALTRPAGAQEIHAFVSRDAIEGLATGVIRLDLYRDPQRWNLLRFIKYARKGFSFGTSIPFRWDSLGTYFSDPASKTHPTYWRDVFSDALDRQAQAWSREYEHARPSARTQLVRRVAWSEWMLDLLRDNVVDQHFPDLPNPSFLMIKSRMPVLGRVCDILASLPRPRPGTIFDREGYPIILRLLQGYRPFSGPYGSFDLPPFDSHIDEDSTDTFEFEVFHAHEFKEIEATIQWISDPPVRCRDHLVQWTSTQHPQFPLQALAAQYVVEVLGARFDRIPMMYPVYVRRDPHQGPSYLQTMAATFQPARALRHAFLPEHGDVLLQRLDTQAPEQYVPVLDGLWVDAVLFHSGMDPLLRDGEHWSSTYCVYGWDVPSSSSDDEDNTLTDDADGEEDE